MKKERLNLNANGTTRSVAFGRRASRRSRAGFTLLEITIALAVFLLLLAIVFVPLNQALVTFNAGRADINLQQAAQQTMNQIQSELKKAIYVYPNDVLPGVTDAAPYSGYAPYFSGNSCARAANTSRLDFISARVDGDDTEIPVKPSRYITTYYSRRLRIADYDSSSNPIVLYRAQIPYEFGDDTKTGGSGTRTDLTDVQAGSSRYPTDQSACTTTPTGAAWLEQDAATNEPNLETDLTADAAKSPSQTIYGSHTLLTPRDTALPAPQAPANLTPDISFLCADTNGDGKIDQVTVNLALTQYDQSNTGGGSNAPRSHQIRLSKVVDLPNIR